MVSCIACGLSHDARKFGITFHRLPKKAELQAAWLKFLNRTEESILKFAVLCSHHFEESDFDRSAFRVILNRNAVPSKFVQRHKYDKISSSKPVTTFSTGYRKVMPCTSKQTEAAEPPDYIRRVSAFY